MYKSARNFLQSFESISLLFKEKKFKFSKMALDFKSERF